MIDKNAITKSEFKISAHELVTLPLSIIVKIYRDKFDEIILNHLDKVVRDKCDYRGHCNIYDITQFINDNKIDCIIDTFTLSSNNTYSIKRGDEVLSIFTVVISTTEDIKTNSRSCIIVLKEIT